MLEPYTRLAPDDLEMNRKAVPSVIRIRLSTKR